jgi:hypothetical protein
MKYAVSDPKRGITPLFVRQDRLPGRSPLQCSTQSADCQRVPAVDWVKSLVLLFLNEVKYRRQGHHFGIPNVLQVHSQSGYRHKHVCAWQWEYPSWGNNFPVPDKIGTCGDEMTVLRDYNAGV